jgi:hypothetical protein
MEQKSITDSGIASIFFTSSFTSKLTPEELLDRLSEKIGPPRFLYERVLKPYTGYIEGQYFKIERIVTGRGGSSNVIQGTIEETDYGSTIKLTMRPPMPVIFILVVIIIISIALMILGAGILIPVLLPVILSVLLLSGFAREVSISKKFLSVLFKDDYIYYEDETTF